MEKELSGKKFRIKCGSKYFETKYGDSPVIEVECKLDYRREGNMCTFFYIGRALAEGNESLLNLKGKTYYGHVQGLGEIVHESELGEEVVR